MKLLQRLIFVFHVYWQKYEICPERIDTFKNISLSTNTVTRRIDNISNNLNSQVNNKTQEFISFSIALEESTDISDTSQLLLFI